MHAKCLQNIHYATWQLGQDCHAFYFGFRYQSLNYVDLLAASCQHRSGLGDHLLTLVPAILVGV